MVNATLPMVKFISPKEDERLPFSSLLTAFHFSALALRPASFLLLVLWRPLRFALALGTLAALKPLGYEIINLGGGNEPVTINSMISHFTGHLGREAIIDYQPFQGAEMLDTSANVSKAAKLMNWIPSTSPREEFGLTAEWHLGNSDLLHRIAL